MADITAWSEDNLSATAFRQRMSYGSTTIETYPRWATGISTPANGTLYVSWFVPTQNMTVSSFSMAQSTGGTDTGGTSVRRLGLYTTDFTNATLVARTDNDPTIGNTSFSIPVRNFSTVGGYPSSYTLVAGSTYGFALVYYNTGGTFAPGSIGSGFAANSAINGLAPRISTAVAGANELPASFAYANANTNIFPWGRLS